MSVHIEFSENPISNNSIPCSNLKKKRLIKKELAVWGKILLLLLIETTLAI